MEKLKFYKCSVCGNIAIKLVDKNTQLKCCEKFMEELKANNVDAATEKHIPYVTIENNVATAVVGEIKHPMLTEHYINFIVFHTTKGYFVKTLKPNDEPTAQYVLNDNEKLLAVYEYCNLHGLWVKEI